MIFLFQKDDHFEEEKTISVEAHQQKQMEVSLLFKIKWHLCKLISLFLLLSMLLGLWILYSRDIEQFSLLDFRSNSFNAQSFCYWRSPLYELWNFSLEIYFFIIKISFNKWERWNQTQYFIYFLYVTLILLYLFFLFKWFVDDKSINELKEFVSKLVSENKLVVDGSVYSLNSSK